MSRELPSFLIDAGELLQHVSRVVYRGSPLYYGRGSTNRYDDPAEAYGVLYLGRDLPTALMESVFHKHQWLEDTKRSIALKEVQARMVRAVGVLNDMLLADLTAPGVMAGYFALFERAGTKISVIEDIDLVDHVDWPRFVATYRIGIEPDPGPVVPDDEAP